MYIPTFSTGLDTDLDSLGKEVPGLGRVLRCLEGRCELADDISSRVVRLADKSEGGNHGQPAVLDLLKLLLGELLRRVVEVEGVERSGVSDANVADDAVGALLLDSDNSLVLEPGTASNDLVDGALRDSREGLERVEFTEVSVALGSGEGAEESRPEETDNGELSDTAMGELSLTEPLKVAHEVSLNVKRVVERGKRLGGEANGVESNISRKAAVEGVRRRSEREGLGALGPLNVQGGGRPVGLSGGEGRGRGGGKGGDGKLHGYLACSRAKSTANNAPSDRAFMVPAPGPGDDS